MDDIYPDNLHEGDGEGERFEDEVSNEENPAAAANPFDDLPTIPSLPTDASNSQFDPFAPQDAPAGGENLLGDFVDNLANDDANDPLSGAATATVTENDKKNDSVWWQLDPVKDETNNGGEETHDVLMGTPNENFVDESAKQDTTTTSGGGFFSRMRGLISSPDEGSGMQPIFQTTRENLEHGGNSLPHPDALKHGASGDYLEEDNEIENSSVDDDEDDEEHASSLPHPQEVLRSGMAKNHQEEPQGLKLDENGLSLPHPESVRLENDDHENDIHDAASADSESDMIEVTSDDESSEEEEDEHHYREHSTSSGSSSASGTYLDRYGNSLPHPDEHNFAGRPTMKLGNLKNRIQSLVSTNNDKESMKDIDLETGSGADSDSESDSDSDFDDEHKTSTTSNLRKFIDEQRDNPRSRLICYSVLALLLLLVIVIPVSNRSKSKPLDTTSQVAATQPPSITFDNEECVDEIVLTDRHGNDLVNGTSTSDDVACYTMDEPIHFRFKRCRPASPLDWVGVFPARSMFMERLWKDHYDGVYLCGDQPCPTNDPLNQKGGPPRAKSLKAPPIKIAGEYRLFLVKDSSWPYEYVDLTPSFAVVDQKSACADRENVFNGASSSKPGFAPDKNAESIYIQTPTVVPTGIGTSYVTSTGTEYGIGVSF